jgi:hypothetical protein
LLLLLSTDRSIPTLLYQRSAPFCTVLHSYTNSLEDDEDSSIREVTAVSVPGGRSRLDVTLAKAGNWVLLEGVDASITRTATITDAEVRAAILL